MARKHDKVVKIWIYMYILPFLMVPATSYPAMIGWGVGQAVPDCGEGRFTRKTNEGYECVCDRNKNYCPVSDGRTCDFQPEGCPLEEELSNVVGDADLAPVQYPDNLTYRANSDHTDGVVGDADLAPVQYPDNLTYRDISRATKQQSIEPPESTTGGNVPYNDEWPIAVKIIIPLIGGLAVIVIVAYVLRKMWKKMFREMWKKICSNREENSPSPTEELEPMMPNDVKKGSSLVSEADQSEEPITQEEEVVDATPGEINDERGEESDEENEAEIMVEDSAPSSGKPEPAGRPLTSFDDLRKQNRDVHDRHTMDSLLPPGASTADAPPLQQQHQQQQPVASPPSSSSSYQSSISSQPETRDTPDQQSKQAGQQPTEMTYEQKDCLCVCQNYFVTNMADVKKVCDCLLSCGAFTRNMVEQIKAKKTDSDKVRALLKLMSKRTGEEFDQFYEALIESGDTGLACRLKPFLTSNLLTGQGAMER